MTSDQLGPDVRARTTSTVLNEGYSVSKAAERLGVSYKTLSQWKEQYEEGRLVAGFKGAQATPEEQELRRLREELRQTKLENEILKKASAFSPSKSCLCVCS